MTRSILLLLILPWAANAAEIFSDEFEAAAPKDPEKRCYSARLYSDETGLAVTTRGDLTFDLAFSLAGQLQSLGDLMIDINTGLPINAYATIYSTCND